QQLCLQDIKNEELYSDTVVENEVADLKVGISVKNAFLKRHPIDGGVDGVAEQGYHRPIRKQIVDETNEINGGLVTVITTLSNGFDAVVLPSTRLQTPTWGPESDDKPIVPVSLPML
ncbi:hypothetical protein BX616_006149, partial [Lobosporangium transversale]